MTQGKKLPSSFWNKIFLEALKNSLGSITHTCSEAKVTPQSYYAYRLSNPKFAKKADAILETICLPILEDMARSRAMKSSDKLLMFLLRNLAGKKWNQDKKEEALAREEPKLLLYQRVEDIKDDQCPLTKPEIAAGLAYEQALDEEDDEYEDSEEDGSE